VSSTNRIIYLGRSALLSLERVHPDPLTIVKEREALAQVLHEARKHDSKRDA